MRQVEELNEIIVELISILLEILLVITSLWNGGVKEGENTKQKGGEGGGNAFLSCYNCSSN